MPSMQMFGRRWLAGTDDLVFPGLLELLMRGIWLTLMSCVLCRYYQWTFNCLTGGLLVRVYLIGIVVMHSIIILLVIVLVNRSAQGAIYDTKARRVVPNLLVAKIILLLPEIALNVLGTIWTYTNCIQCDNEHFTSTVVEIGVLFNWVMLGGLVFVLAMVLDPVGSLKLQDGANGSVDTDIVLHRKVTRIWVRRFRWFFCWLIRDEHSHEAFSQAAGLMSSMFRNTDIVPSDFIAGFVLLRVKQKRESREQRRLALLAEQRYNCTSIVNECFTGKPNWMCLKKARHYLQLSVAIYGWPFLIYRYCITGLFKMMPKFFCCACFRTKPTVVKEDNCCLCNFAAIRYMSKLHSKDILFASFVNHIFELPFFVTVDHETSSIVIAIRGSLSMRDIFTDLTAIVEKLDAQGVPSDSYAHKGMLCSAKYIKKELDDYNVIEKAYTNFPEYNLIITGHSLGAGTAVLLAFYMRPLYPNLKVYAFATPAGLLSREAARIAEEFTLSIGVGDDMVMHMTIDNVEDLRTNMVQVLQSCRLPKYRVFLNGFGYALFGVPSRDLESTWRHRTTSEMRNSPLLSTHSPVLSMITQNDGFPTDTISNHHLVPTTSSYPNEQPISISSTYNELAARRYSKIRLYTPGHILHITKKKKSKEQKKADKKSGTNSNEYNYEMRWATPEDFKELRVMPRMLLDHLPENVLKTLDNVLEEQRTEIGFDLAQLKWRYNSEQEITAAEEQRELAQRLTLEADRLFGRAKDSVIKNKLDIDYQSKVKVKDIEYKCKEIEKQKGDLDEEICLLLSYQVRIENANKLFVGDALDVIAECLRLRNCRQSMDLVFDDVEKELLRERELIFGINDQLEELQDKVMLQIRKLRTFVYNLTVDLRRKKNALKIEEQNENLNENNVEISILNNRNIFKPATISTTEWDQFTLDIISAANKELVDGRPIRAFFDKCLNKMFEDLVSQSAAVDLAFKLRVKEYLEVIEKLNEQRVETVKNVEEVQETIEKMKKAIDDREAYLALAHSRLLNRTRREGVELCRDELELRLYDEVVQLEHDVKSLQNMMAESVECRRRLKQSTARIDVQLQVKQNSLRIDNELCTEQRKRINYQAF